MFKPTPMLRAAAVALLLLVAAPGWAQIFVYSDADGGGGLTTDGFDFGTPNPVVFSFSAGGESLFTATTPQIVTPGTDGGLGLFALDPGVELRIEIVAINSVVRVKVGPTILDAIGQSAVLGTTLGPYAPVEYQIVVPDGTMGTFPVTFKVTADSIYAATGNRTMQLTNLVGGGAPPTPTPMATPVIDHYVLYKATASKLDLSDKNKLPKNWAITLDDAHLDNSEPGDPENYIVLKELSLANPAVKNAEPLLDPALHYLRYKLRPGREGVGPADASAKFPRAEKPPKRRWHLANQFGDIVIESKRVKSMLLPAGKAEAPGVPVAPADTTHYVCYGVKPSKVPSAQEPDTRGKGKGKFRDDLQAYTLDQFDDCAMFLDSIEQPFAGTSVAGTCLVDVVKPVELCNPADKMPVQPSRSTSAVIKDSTAVVRDVSLLCYQTKRATKVKDAQAALLGGVAVGSRLKQAKHAKHTLKTASQINVAPGNQFPRPLAVDTVSDAVLCVPTTVLSVALAN